MAKFRENPCIYYVCEGTCSKGRANASHKGRCQTCEKYRGRKGLRHINKKKAKLDKIRRSEVRE